MPGRLLRAAPGLWEFEKPQVAANASELDRIQVIASPATAIKPRLLVVAHGPGGQQWTNYCLRMVGRATAPLGIMPFNI